MKRFATKGSAGRSALTAGARGAGSTAGAPRRPGKGPGNRGPGLGAAGLLALGLWGLGSCAADVPVSTPGQGVVALFNPGAAPPVVPTPTNLVRVGGKLQIPVDPTEATNGALATFNNYLRGLDGFPPDSTAETFFSDAIDSSSLPEGVVIYDATAKVVLGAPDAVPSIDVASGSKVLSISTKNRWSSGHTYFVGLFSWQDSGAVHGLRGADSKAVLADTAFALLRSTTPLYAACQDASNPACACPDLTAKTCHAVVDGVTDAQAQQLEVARLGIAPIISEVLGLKGRALSDLVMGFSFTISQRPFAAFDLVRSQAPFPSNLLLANRGLDPLADVLVNVPILPTDDARTQALKGGLNTLDGFSTTGSVQFPVDSVVTGGVPVDINAATVLPNQTALLINVSVPTNVPAFKAAPLHAVLDATTKVSGFAGQVWVTPTSPLLGDRTLYASVLTTSIQDMNKQPLTPAPLTVLLTQSSPLVSAATADTPAQSLVPTIPLAQALQLEPLRLGLAPLVASIKAKLAPAKSQIAAITLYRTQSIVKPMQLLLGGTTQLGPVIPSTVTITSTTPSAMLPTPLNMALAAVVHGTLTVRRVVDLRGTFNVAGRLTADPANNDVIPFMLTIPIASVPSGAPVVIAQHGLARWRGDNLAIAATLAGKGMAMIAIDAIYHGGRVVCLDSTDCAAGVACMQPAPVKGVVQAGKCAGGAYLVSTATPPPSALPGTPDLLPDAKLPGRDFNNFTNPFAQRDNFRQHTLDLFQLVRVIKDTTAGGLVAQVAAQGKLDPTKISYFGQSLGAIMGVNFLALSPSVNLGALNVGGGDLVDIYTDPTSILSASAAAALGVLPGSPAFFSLKENFRWILDPADPINFARFVRTPDAKLTPGRTAAKVILQEAGMDTVIPNAYTLALGKELGLPVDTSGHLLGINQEGGAAPTNVTTFFPTASHLAIFDLSPANQALAVQIQAQVATYLATGLGGPPTVQ